VDLSPLKEILRLWSTFQQGSLKQATTMDNNHTTAQHYPSPSPLPHPNKEVRVPAVAFQRERAPVKKRTRRIRPHLHYIDLISNSFTPRL